MVSTLVAGTRKEGAEAAGTKRLAERDRIHATGSADWHGGSTWLARTAGARRTTWQDTTCREARETPGRTRFPSEHPRTPDQAEVQHFLHKPAGGEDNWTGAQSTGVKDASENDL